MLPTTRHELATHSELSRLLRKAIWPPIVLVLFLFAALASVFLHDRDRMRWVDHTDRVIALGTRVEMLVVDMQTGLRGYLFTRERAFLAPYTNALPEVDPDLESLRQMVSDNPAQLRRVGSIARHFEDWRSFADSILARPPVGLASARARLREGRTRMEAFRSEIGAFLGVEARLREERSRNSSAIGALTLPALIAAAAVAVVGLAYFTRRNFAELRHFYSEMLAKRDEFVQVASHELKTPLTSLGMQIQLLERLASKGDHETIERRLPHYLASSRRQISRLSRLIEDILDATRITSGKLAIEPRPGELSRLVRDAISRHEPQASEAGSTLSLELPGVPVEGEWDLDRISQVLSNLLANAIKYGARGSIEVRLIRKPGVARIEVIDHGPGIPAGDQERIFERFERAISADRVSGLGLGLYISRRIAEGHGGRIWVESVPGGGSKFILELPVQARGRPERAA